MLLEFIKRAEPGDRLLGCFYEFSYPPATDALLDALGRGVDVQIIVDLKDNAAKFPRNENLDELKRSGFPAQNYTARTARPNTIAHNKFMVLIRGGQPVQVWTGSTNLTLGGVAGQTNVGHWLRNPAVAQKYADYWDLLENRPRRNRRRLGCGEKGEKRHLPSCRRTALGGAGRPARPARRHHGVVFAETHRVVAHQLCATAGHSGTPGMHHPGLRNRRRVQDAADRQHRPQCVDLCAA